MDPTCLLFRLTAEERTGFECDEFLIIDGALTSEHTADLLRAADCIHAELLAADAGRGIFPWPHAAGAGGEATANWELNKGLAF